MDELLHVSTNHEINPLCKFKQLTDSDLALCRHLDLKLHNTPSTFSIFDHLGNMIIYALVLWRIVLQLLSCLSFEDRLHIAVYQLPEVTESADTDSFKYFVDSRVHLLDCVGDPNRLEIDQFGAGQKFNSTLKYMVNNYCFPRFWPKSEKNTLLNSKFPEHRLSFGIHPQTVQSTSSHLLEEYLYTLEELLKTENTVAVGECGLDISDTSKNINLFRQIEFFEKQLKLAISRHLPIIIHCRGDAVLHFKLLESLTKLCPSDHPIHWHCFTPRSYVFEKITEVFTYIVFGVTPFSFTKRQVESLVFSQPLEYFVLESDAPLIYFQQQPSDPYVVLFVAERMAQLMNTSLDDIIRTTTRNMQQIYNL